MFTLFHLDVLFLGVSAPLGFPGLPALVPLGGASAPQRDTVLVARVALVALVALVVLVVPS